MPVDCGWLESFTKLVDVVCGWVWGLPLVGAILVTGLVLTLCLRFTHIFNLKRAFVYMFHTEEGDEVSGEVSSFAALCTALSATIGTGNIVGVATAIGTGGPGALFWMEVAAFLGMATKYAEGLLAVKYREVTPDGRVLGGPFYYIENGLGRRWKPLAVAFAAFGVLAGVMGIGTITQIHGITSAVQRFFDPQFNPADMATGIGLFGTTYSVPVVVAGIVVTLCVGLVVIGGIKRIAKVSSVIVPFMAIFYIAVIVLLLLGNLTKVTAAIQTIVLAAFNPEAVTGGVVGTVFIAIQKGVARGIFSNEAGLGSAPIAAAAARTNEPARQGLVCMTGTFIDTIVICTMTGLAIVVTGAWEPSLGLEGVRGVQPRTCLHRPPFRHNLVILPYDCAYLLRVHHDPRLELLFREVLGVSRRHGAAVVRKGVPRLICRCRICWTISNRVGGVGHGGRVQWPDGLPEPYSSLATLACRRSHDGGLLPPHETRKF